MKKSLLLGIAALGLFGVSAAGIALVNAESAKEVSAGTTDSSIEIRFTKPNLDGWRDSSKVYLHTYDEGGDPTTEWPGYEMTYLYNNEDNQAVYTWQPEAEKPLYGKIIFNDHNGHQTPETSSPASSKGFYTDGSSVGMYNLESTYYLYDYEDTFEGSVYCYAWNEYTPGIGNNGTFPGVVIDPVLTYAKNGLFYSITLDVKFNSVIFSNGAGKQTVDLKPTAGKSPKNGWACYVDGTKTDTKYNGNWWADLDYSYAHNWANNMLLLKSVETSDESDTKACETLYADAKTTYQNMTASMKGKVSESFPDALDRMEKWAEHNGDSFVVTDGVGVFGTKALPFTTGSTSDETTMAVLIISAVSIAVTLGLIVFYKRKANKE